VADCNGICLTAYDFGILADGIAVAHPDCLEHGVPPRKKWRVVWSPKWSAWAVIGPDGYTHDTCEVWRVAVRWAFEYAAEGTDR
jgi:hypothetical protein